MATASQARTRTGRKMSPFFWWLVAVLSAFVATYGFLHASLGERLFAPQLLESFRARPWGIFLHALLASIALILGPFQFHRGLLLRYRALHRLLGKVYVICAIAGSGVIGLYMAAHSFGGWVTHLGFGSLAALTLVTTLVAFIKIRQGEVVAHREWMIRSFAMIFAAVTLRLLLPLLVVVHKGNFTPAYLWVSWLCWVPNLILVELYISKYSRRRNITNELPHRSLGGHTVITEKSF